MINFKFFRRIALNQGEGRARHFPGIGKTAYKSPAENAFAHAERAVKGKTVAAAGNRRQLAADFRGIFFRSAKPGFRFAHASP